MPLSIGILGPLEVVCNGRAVHISGGKERALLVRLALDSGRTVSVQRLVESLWDGEPPASAGVSVRVLISRIRKALGATGAGDLIQTRPPGYVLLADHVDAVQFETLCSRGHEQLNLGLAVEAAMTLEAAQALWRGERLAEISSVYLLAEAGRLDEMLLSAREARIAAQVECGRHAAVLTELESLCRAHPLRESLWGLRITALYRCSRQADALAAYRRLRQVLAEELGIDPDPALQQLHAAVLAQDPLLGRRPQTGATARLALVPLPASLAFVDVAPRLGGGEDLQAAQDAWASALRGTSGVTLVTGEAGIGKSRLVRELAHLVHQRGSVVLFGRSDEDLAIPYRPFVEALSHLVTYASERVLNDAGLRNLTHLARLVPNLADRRPDLPPPAPADFEVERYLLFGAVASLLTESARDCPILLVLDDLHWADRPTLQLLRHLASMNLGRVLLIGVYRDGLRPAGALAEMVGALAGQAAVTRITPHNLTCSQAVSLMQAVVGRDPDEACATLVDLLHRDTDGNPFYLVEIFKHLRESGLIVDLPDGRCTPAVGHPEIGLPASIREVLRARLARLGPDVAQVLSAAAVIGQEFDVDLLGLIVKAGGGQPAEVLELLETAEHAGLVCEAVDPPGRFRFGHALVQHTIYSDMGATRRTLTHARVAGAMELQGGHLPGELAYHFLAGISSSLAPKAIQYARAAGALAMSTSAPGEAVRWFSAAFRALAPSGADAEHVRGLIDLGVAERQAGQPSGRDTLLAAAGTAKRIGRPDLLVEAALAADQGGFSRLGHIDADKISVVEQAIAVAPDNTAVRARLLSGLASELMWHPDHTLRITTANEAIAEARKSDDPGILLQTILQVSPALWVPETSEQRITLGREAVAIAQRAAIPAATFAATHLLAPALLEGARDSVSNEELASAEAYATEVREPFLRWISLTVRGCLAIAHGDLARGEDAVTAALQVANDGGLPDGQAANEQETFIIRWQQGRLGETLPHLRQVRALGQGATSWPELALAEATCGAKKQAQAMLKEACEGKFHSFYGAPWLGRMCLWADIAAELADEESAAILYPMLLPWKHLFATGGPVPVHGVSLALGRLAIVQGDFESAEGHFAESAHIHGVVQSPFGQAETAFYLGRLLIGRDDLRAQSLLEAALQIANRFGFGDIKRRTHHALQTT